MASSKDIFEAGVFKANIFAAGVFRGVSASVVPSLPGMEWTLDAAPVEWTLGVESPHWTLDACPVEWSVEE